MLVVRDDVLAAHSDLPAVLFEAYSAAKQPYLAALAGSAIPADQLTANDRRYRTAQELAAGGDPLPYGIVPNREMIDTLVGYAYRQHIIARQPAAEEIFAKQTWDLVG